jgi:hypothetical protein
MYVERRFLDRVSRLHMGLKLSRLLTREKSRVDQYINYSSTRIRVKINGQSIDKCSKENYVFLEIQFKTMDENVTS